MQSQCGFFCWIVLGFWEIWLIESSSFLRCALTQVVGLLIFRWRCLFDWFEESFVVELVDLVESSELYGFDVPLGVVLMDDLGLVEVVDGFCEGVVVCVFYVVDGVSDVGLGQSVGVADR